MYLWALLRPFCQGKHHTWALAHEPDSTAGSMQAQEAGSEF